MRPNITGLNQAGLSSPCGRELVVDAGSLGVFAMFHSLTCALAGTPSGAQGLIAKL